MDPARNIYVAGPARDSQLSTALDLQLGSDLQSGRAQVGAYLSGQARIGKLRVQIDRGREERERLDRLVLQKEKRLDRAGRIVRQEADSITIDLSSFYKALGQLPPAKLTEALDEFFAKVVIGLLARTNQRYLLENAARQKVFLQLLRQLRELFLLVTRRERASRLLADLAKEIDHLVGQLCAPQGRIWVHGQVGPRRRHRVRVAQRSGPGRPHLHLLGLNLAAPGPPRRRAGHPGTGDSRGRPLPFPPERRDRGAAPGIFFSLNGQIFWETFLPPCL
ncbi:MAG: hypothetical protein FJY95_13785 [Candidatus Handelsmanbacteria bacterium]|nr:hypothetical protein [Candidatus Handelsmanbacteria bacterium]